MNAHANPTTPPDPNADPALVGIAASLDALARADAALAPADLEARIAAQSSPLLAPPAPIPFATPRRAFPALRLAAAVALAATLGALWLAKVRTPADTGLRIADLPTTTSPTTPATPPTTLAAATTAEEEALFALAGWDEDPAAGLSELRQAADDLRSSLNQPWNFSDLSAEGGATQ